MKAQHRVLKVRAAKFPIKFVGIWEGYRILETVKLIGNSFIAVYLKAQLTGPSVNVPVSRNFETGTVSLVKKTVMGEHTKRQPSGEPPEL